MGRDGIRPFNVVYWNGALEAKIRGDGRKHVLKFDPRDLSRLCLAEPDGASLEVPCRDLRHPPVSLRELQQGAQLLRQQGDPAIDEEPLFRVIQQQRALIAAAKRRSKRRRALQDGPLPCFPPLHRMRQRQR